MIFYQFQNKKKEMKTFKEYNLDDKINRMVIDAIKKKKLAKFPPYLSVIIPNNGPNRPHKNNCKPIANPNCVIEISKSVEKSKQKRPNVCLIPKEIITTKLAAINVIKAALFLINFSELI